MRPAADQAADLAGMNYEQQLIEQAQAGDGRAFKELIFKYDRHILGLTLRLLENRDEAKEAYQETFLKIFRSIGRFRHQSSFDTWVYRIAINVCLDRLRYRKKLLQEVSIDSAPLRRIPFNEVFPAANPESGRISRALNTLSGEERLVFELKHYQGLKL